MVETFVEFFVYIVYIVLSNILFKQLPKGSYSICAQPLQLPIPCEQARLCKFGENFGGEATILRREWAEKK